MHASCIAWHHYCMSPGDCGHRRRRRQRPSSAAAPARAARPLSSSARGCAPPGAPRQDLAANLRVLSSHGRQHRALKGEQCAYLYAERVVCAGCLFWTSSWSPCRTCSARPMCTLRCRPTQPMYPRSRPRAPAAAMPRRSPLRRARSGRPPPQVLSSMPSYGLHASEGHLSGGLAARTLPGNAALTTDSLPLVSSA